MAPGAGPAALLAALEGLDEQVAELRLPLPVVGAVPARRLRREMADQLDDYVLPRLRRLDAPLLAVVGGPTGAGKSTLVNSLVGRRVSAAGVLRPTTRSAVLVYHPSDDAWFEDQRILPGPGPRHRPRSADPTTLQLVPSDEHARPGSPCSTRRTSTPSSTPNRELATQLLAAADMWLFVTTAARYADAVPWEFLRDAATRGTAVAIVLDRVPPEAVDEVRAHLATMLHRAGPRATPRCSSCPRRPPYDALLPPDVVDPIRTWLHGIAGDAEVRAAVVRHTLDRRAAVAGRPRVRAGRGRATPRPRPRAGCVATSIEAYDARAGAASTRRAATGRCCAARCSPAGRSSSAPAR